MRCGYPAASLAKRRRKLSLARGDEESDREAAAELLECGRWSVRGGGRRVTTSRYHYIVSTANGQYIAYRVTRAP